MKYLITLITFLCFQSLLSQAISGVVYDAKTGKNLSGASVYFANTSIGTITNTQGYFSIDPKFMSNTNLVISHIGYLVKTIRFEDLRRNLGIELHEEFFEVPEVIVVSDPFSRRQKLELFRQEFLGDNVSSEQCTIENEDSIKLYFNSSTNTLEAYAEEPIMVRSGYLGYKLRFDLKEFKVRFKTKSLERDDNIETTTIIGHCLFEDLGKKESKYVLRRNSAYQGSIQHFIRTLWNQNWADETFEFRVNSKKAKVLDIISVSLGSFLFTKKITFARKTMRIKYKKGLFNYWSTLHIISGSTISIDQYGSYMPYYQLKFEGYMASLRISDLLPLDYEEEVIVD